MIGNQAFKRTKTVIRYVDDGVQLSDLYLASVVLCVVKGAECYQAFFDSASAHFLFYIKGDTNVIRDTISRWYSAKLENPAEQLKKFLGYVSSLKVLLMKAREGEMIGQKEVGKT